MPHQEWMTSEIRQCIENCTNCANKCEETIAHCLMLGGDHADVHHIGLLMDCAAICRTSATFMLHGSHHHHRTCEVCAEVCDACAKDCERIANGDKTMLECAELCRRCAESCHRMAGAAV